MNPANALATLPSESASAWVKRRLAGSPKGVAQVGGVTKADASGAYGRGRSPSCQGVLCLGSWGSGRKRIRRASKAKLDHNIEP